MLLSDGVVSVNLPDLLMWVDEWVWTPAVVSRSYSITGAEIIESGDRQSGRPITLDTLDACVLTRTQLDALRTLQVQTGSHWTLTGLRGQTWAVLPAETDWLKADPWWHAETPGPGQQHTATLRLAEVAE